MIGQVLPFTFAVFAVIALFNGDTQLGNFYLLFTIAFLLRDVLVVLGRVLKELEKQ